MSKPKIPNQRKANLSHKKRIEKYAILIQQVYDNIAKEAARYAVLSGAKDDQSFSFDDYPLSKEAIKKLQSTLVNEVTGIIMSGTSDEWKESNLVQDLVAKKVLTAYTGTSKHGNEYSRYFETNPESLKAFQERKDNGMNLSTRVWNLSEQYKRELEESITAAIAPGTSAMQLAAQVKQYLKEPDKRFRRIKEKMSDGSIKWHLSNPAKAYHPGQGVYRSSARNAQRLARTEINMSYRTAEQKRWEQFDFVVGYEIKTTQNGHHVEDICDDLAGKYPKSFKFRGWHPQCLCYCIPILKTEDEFWADDDAKSVNEITDVPQGFKEWIRDNEDRINVAEERSSLPYFIRDNREDVEYILHPELRKKTTLEIAAERHAARTASDIKDIQDRWDAKQKRDANTIIVANNVLKVAQSWSEVDYSRLEQLIADNNLTALNEESRKVAQAIKTMRDEEKALSDLIPDVHGWHDMFGITELKEAYRSIDGTLDYWKSKGMNLVTDSDLHTLKTELEKKIKFVENHGAYKAGALQKPYWQVLQDSYIKYLDKVDDRIWWIDTKSDADSLISKISSASPKAAAHWQKEVDWAVSNSNKTYLKTCLIKLDKWDKIIDLESQLSVSGGVDITALQKYIQGGNINKAWAEYNNLKSKIVNISNSLYDGGLPFTTAELTKIKDYENKIIQNIINNGSIDRDMNEEYHNYILQISEKYYGKQRSIYSLSEQNALKKAASDYLARPSVNPNWIWGTDVGGVYGGKASKRISYKRKLRSDITEDELSIVQRFTNGSTFSNAYNLRKSSPYWEKKWKEKMANLTPQQAKEMEQIIEEWSQGANFTLDRMVRYNGITFRGLDSGGGPELRAQLKKAFNNGSAWVNEASCSTSMKYSVARSFDGDLIMVIHNKTGAYIHEISDYSSEYEIMTLRGAKYRVIKPPTQVGSRWIAELEEI